MKQNEENSQKAQKLTKEELENVNGGVSGGRGHRKIDSWQSTGDWYLSHLVLVSLGYKKSRLLTSCKSQPVFLILQPSSFSHQPSERSVSHAAGSAHGGDNRRDDARQNLQYRLPSFFFHVSVFLVVSGKRKEEAEVVISYLLPLTSNLLPLTT